MHEMLVWICLETKRSYKTNISWCFGGDKLTEQEAKEALFKLNYEYMHHSPKERLELYDEYVAKRAEIQKALRKIWGRRKTAERWSW